MIPLESGLHWATALLIPLLIISLQVMGFFSRGNKFQVEGRTVLLTGGSYGMGKELAKQLSQRGAHLILVARDAAKLQIALDYAKAAAKNPATQRFHFISADVTSKSENTRLLAEATAWNGGSPPEIVWANAGSSTPGLFIETDMEIMRRQMDLNYWAAAYLAQDTLKAWLYPSTPYKPQPKGAKPEASRHFIMTSSAISFCNMAGYAAYGPAKTALRALADTLRQEILIYNGARRSSKTTAQAPAPFDINVQIVCPGNISSPGHVEEDKTKHAVTVLLEETDPVQTELEAALAALKGLDNGNYMTATNWLVELARISTIGNSPKNNIVTDTIGQWVTALVWLFIGPDMDGKAWGWGKKEGFPEFKPLVDPRAKQV